MEEFIWSEKYRPKTVQDVLLPDHIKNAFVNFLKDKNVPNVLLSGPPGCGKTTLAKAILEDLGCSYMVIPASLQGNIDILRNEISTFASSRSFKGGRKYVILDEADYLNQHSTMPALRNFMDEFSANCGFILTCNFRQRIIGPLLSRLDEVRFEFTTGEKEKLAVGFFKRTMSVLDQEGVTYDKGAVAGVVQKHFPDFRKVLNELQYYAKSHGSIDSGILAKFSRENFLELVGYLKAKNFKEMRKWVGLNIDMDTDKILRTLYDNLYDVMKPQTIPPVVLILSKYAYQNALVSDKEINLAACLTEIMLEADFL